MTSEITAKIGARTTVEGVQPSRACALVLIGGADEALNERTGALRAGQVSRDFMVGMRSSARENHAAITAIANRNQIAAQISVARRSPAVFMGAPTP